MTDEQLREKLEEVTADIERLSRLERPLTPEEEQYRARLLKRKHVLDKIKEAKEKNRRDDELYNSAVYEWLVPWGEKHPVLMAILMHFMKIRWGSSLTPIAIREAGKRKDEKR